MKTILTVIICFFSCLVPGQGQNPINLFQPEVGQTHTVINLSRDSSWGDTAVYTVTSQSGDSFYVSTDDQIETSISWQAGVLSAPMLLGNGTLDTNGIYTVQMNFPEDYSTGPMGQTKTGYVLDHVIQDFTFDTLLVSCRYMSYIDIGNICDFVTPSGYLVQSVNNDCFCIGGGYANNLEEETLEFISGEPSSLGPRRKLLPSPETDVDDWYNLKGQQARTGSRLGIRLRKVER
ncbi:hypothetical protein ACFL5V_10905 [Fibrobacterota bacterium]